MSDRKKIIEEMSKRSTDLSKSVLIRRLCAINDIRRTDYRDDYPTEDPLMNLCISAHNFQPRGLGLYMFHVGKPSSVWNFLERNLEPQRDRGFMAIEDSFRSAVSEYEHYKIDVFSVVLVFKMGHYFCYTHSDAALPFDEMGDFTYVKTAPFDDVVQPKTEPNLGGRMIFSLEALLSPFETPEEED